MKRFFAILLCFFILTFNTISVKAMDIGVAIEVGQEVFYAGWDQILALINGVVIPTSQYAGAADKTVAMAAFYDDWLGTLSGLTQYWGGDIADSETGAISINYPLDYGMSGKYANNFLSEYANLVQDVNNGFALPLNGNVLAAWNRYNNLWINRYLNAFNGSNDLPVLNPDPNYNSYLTLLNGLGFWSSPTIQYNAFTSELPATYITDTTKYSYLVNANNMSSGYSITDSLQYNNEAYILACSPLTFDIVGSGDNYSLSLRNSAIDYSICDGEDPYYKFTFCYNKLNNLFRDNGVVNQYTFNSNYIVNVSAFNKSGSLSYLLDWLADKTRNITLYVNGDCWLYVSEAPEDIILAPDVIRNESGQIIGNDVYFPEQDLMIDLINWQNLVDDKILTGEDITFDDLIDAGVITDADGNIIDNNDLDSYFKKRSISGVIDDALDDTQAIALVPDLPVPPDPGDTDPFNWNFPEFIPDIPDGNFQPRQTGLSVLARIINVTNQSLPGELIAMFWGIVITLVILGIIKIAHK